MIQIEKAVYEGDYTVRIVFSDSTEQLVDFGPYLLENPHPQYNKYLDPETFKTFSVEMRNVVWGKNWDLIFPVEQLYQGRVL